MAIKRYQLDQETLKLLNILESCDEEERRRVAIFDLADRGGMNAARILIETFDRTMWRTTKISIIQALGKVRHDRATEFLCQTAMAIDDFAMAAEAVLAMGQSDDPVAGEFLCAIIRTPDHPLLREALAALGNMNFFPCEAEVASFLTGKRQNIPVSVIQSAVIAAGLRGYRRCLKMITETAFTEPSGPMFNTAVMALGRLGNADTLSALERLDTRYRAFAHQLKLSAIEHIRLRLGFTIEDAVGAALNAASPHAMRQAWQILSSFSEDSRKEAIQVLATDATPAFYAMERLVCFRKEAFQDDIAFLAKHFANIPLEIFAGVLREYSMSHPRDEFVKTVSAQGAQFLVRVLSCVRLEKADEILFPMLADKGVTNDIRFAAVNALVAQSLMQGVSFIAIQPMAPDVRTSYGKRLVRLIEAESHEPVKARMVRALGQIRYLGPDAANFLRECLKAPSAVTDAAYAALALCNSDEGTKIICKRLRQIITLPEHRLEVASAIRALAKCDVVSDASCLNQLPDDMKIELKPALLKILCGSTVPEWRAFISQSISEQDFQTRILAIVAAKTHATQDVWNQLFGLLDHPNASISGRALDTITTSGGLDEHIRLFKDISGRISDEAFCRKVFRSLTPRLGDSYEAVTALVDKLIADKPGAMKHPEVLQSAINLRDNLMVFVVTGVGTGISSRKGGIQIPENHAIDETLIRDLKGYGRYSEVIKSVLRSGEVTWRHPELFDARVDKSTVLVQYVKSIDLLLQEKIGSQMFLGQGADFLQKMQSRVVRLELDEDSGFGPDLVTDLDCSLYFSRDSFPAHKLALVCRSVMTGMIMKDQYKVVDGLRAWALLLLIFGRSFKFRGQLMEPLFPISKPHSDSIARIARAMNDLQDVRNRAAHRGTILEMRNMGEMRALCAAVLNDLDSHLQLA